MAVLAWGWILVASVNPSDGMAAKRPARAAGAELPPAPVAWAQEPHARISSAVTMAAEPVEHPGEVEYRFECVDGDGHSSGWQNSPTYTDSKLRPSTEYTYRVTVRDKATGKPCAPPSPPVSVRTRRDGKRLKLGHVAAIDKALTDGTLEMIPLMVTGDKDNRINIVFINRWVPGQKNAYNRPELREEFIEDARHVLKAFDAANDLAIAPYPTYRNFFNVYAVWWPDMPPWNPKDRKGGMHWEDYNEIRARLFLPWQIEGKGWVTHLATLNGSGGGGGAGRRLDERVGDAMIVGNEIEAFIHEFSHTAPGCPDEYTSSGLWGRGGEGLTTTNDYRADSVRWRAWIEPGTPVPTPYTPKYLGKVGVFEGGVHRMAHLFRPTARGCIMGAGSFAGNPDGLCPVCRQGSVQRFYQWVQAIEATRPAEGELSVAGPQTLRFAVSRVKPDPDTQKTEWRLNGRIIATGVDEVDVTFGGLKQFELVFALTDETPFIRPDPPHAQFPHAEARWVITNTKPRPAGRPPRVRLTGRAPVFHGVKDGAVTVKITGGRPPYTYAWSDGASVRDRKGLDAGTYELRVTDSQFRTATATVALQRRADIHADLRSGFRNGAWTLTVDGIKGHKVAATWSTGAKGNRLTGLADGAYTCTLRHADGGEVTRSVTLNEPAKPLSMAVAEVVPSSGGANNGKAFLTVRGGRAPYAFTWSDGTAVAAADRHFLPPGDYTVTVADANATARTVKLTVGSHPALIARGLRIKKAADGRVGIASPGEGKRYLWYQADRPSYLSRFPHGIYTGTFTPAGGQPCTAEAYVIQNKGGMFVDAERNRRNNLGFWIHLQAYVDGTDRAPRTVALSTSRGGRSTPGLLVKDQQVEQTTWNGRVADGRMEITGTGDAGGAFSLLYASRSTQADTPLHVGTEFSPPRSGNYFIAVQDAATGAISNNRVGVALTVGEPEPKAKPVAPTAAKSAKLLMWLDAADIDGDGREDTDPPRRGAVMGWTGKAGDVNFKDFVFYMPNVQNGKGVASWKTIWLQSLGKEAAGCQTLMMVRREHELSSPGTSPWRDLSGLIGVGEYGKQLISRNVADDIRKGAVYLNGRKVDPFRTPMPKGFYVVTYEFPKPLARAFRRTDGHWEGELAEVIAFDGKLSDADRAGLEAHLRRKWLSAAHVETPAAAEEKK